MTQTRTTLAGNETRPRRRACDRPAYFAAAAPHATFISQLIVGDRRPAKEPSPLAAGAYDAGAKISVVRMPAGYRTTIDV